MGHILYPPNIVEGLGNIIFLAGPIQGAPQWQEEAMRIIRKINPIPNIACPRRPFTIRKGFSEEKYAKQVDWETYYLRAAGQNGVIMFWLAKEFEHVCERAYAQTSRFELGEWKIRHERDGVKLVVGIESGFSNERYIRRRMAQDCREVKICPSLEETCKEVLRIL